MINKEWEDFFGIEEASDTSYIETDFNIKQKDAVAVLVSCVNANGYVDLNWMCEASGLSMDELIHSLHGAIYQDPEVYDLCHETIRDGCSERSTCPVTSSSNWKLQKD